MTDPEMTEFMKTKRTKLLDINMIAILNGDVWDIYTLQSNDTWELSMTSMEVSKLEV